MKDIPGTATDDCDDAGWVAVDKVVGAGATTGATGATDDAWKAGADGTCGATGAVGGAF